MNLSVQGYKIYFLMRTRNVLQKYDDSFLTTKGGLFGG